MIRLTSYIPFFDVRRKKYGVYGGVPADFILPGAGKVRGKNRCSPKAISGHYMRCEFTVFWQIGADYVSVFKRTENNDFVGFPVMPGRSGW